MKVKQTTLLLLVCLAVFRVVGVAQAPAIQWQKTYGGSGSDGLITSIQTSDGGFLLGGFSTSGIGNEKTDSCRGMEDYWIVKIDASGNIQWDKTYGGDSTDYLQTVVQTPDGGYLLAGYSQSGMSGDKTDTLYGYFDTWLIRTDSNGIKLWDRTYGGSGYKTDGVVSLRSTGNGGYLMWIVSGSGSNTIKTDSSRGASDYWLVEIDSLGNILWQKVIGGIGIDHILSVIPTSDNGYMAAGFSWSGAGADKTTPSFGGFDYWLIKLDSSANIQWQREYGGSAFDHLMSIKQLNDGSYQLGGFSASGVSGNKTEPSRGGNDYWEMRIDSSGNILWQKTIGGSGADEMRGGLLSVAGGCYIAIGFSQSGISGEKSEASRGADDYWLVRTDSSGNILWDKTLGGDSTEYLYCSVVTSDGGYLITGWSMSGATGDKTDPCRGGFDYWIIKLLPDVTVVQNETPPYVQVTVVPNPFTNSTTITIQSEIVFTDAQFELFDAQGKRVSQLPLVNNQVMIDRDGLLSGTYYYVIFNSESRLNSGNIIIQ